jgi:hypothetical protein
MIHPLAALTTLPLETRLAYPGFSRLDRYPSVLTELSKDKTLSVPSNTSPDLDLSSTSPSTLYITNSTSTPSISITLSVLFFFRSIFFH